MNGQPSDPTALRFTLFETPLGAALAVARGGALVRLGHFDARQAAERFLRRQYPACAEVPDDPLLERLRGQLEEYFDGRRRRFELPRAPVGTPFQRRVWAALEEIPYGETRSYGQLAEAVGRPGGSRAVGQANSANPLGVVIPCHRVIAADGTLGGYAGGARRKRLLLELEGVRVRSGPRSQLRLPLSADRGTRDS